MIAHLRPAEGIGEALAIAGTDVRDAVAVPEDLGAGDWGCGRGGSRGRGDSEGQRDPEERSEA